MIIFLILLANFKFVFQISMIMAEIKERFVARLALQRQLNLLDKVIVLALGFHFHISLALKRGPFLLPTIN